MTLKLKRPPVQHSIMLPMKASSCCFGEANCDAGDKEKAGLKALENYRKAWDEKLAGFKDEPCTIGRAMVRTNSGQGRSDSRKKPRPRPL